jgi:hypothetical protein
MVVRNGANYGAVHSVWPTRLPSAVMVAHDRGRMANRTVIGTALRPTNQDETRAIAAAQRAQSGPKIH